MKRRFDPSKWQLRFGGLFVLLIFLGSVSFTEPSPSDSIARSTNNYFIGFILLIGISLYVDTRLIKTTEDSLSQADKDFNLKPDILFAILAFVGGVLLVSYSFDFPLRDIIFQASLFAGGAVLSFIFYIIRMKGKGYQLEDGHWIKKEEKQKERTG